MCISFCKIFILIKRLSDDFNGRQFLHGIVLPHKECSFRPTVADMRHNKKIASSANNNFFLAFVFLKHVRVAFFGAELGEGERKQMFCAKNSRGREIAKIAMIETRLDVC